MPPPEVISALLSQATATGARSTVLQPLSWLSVILTIGITILPARDAPDWLLILFSVLLVFCILTYIISYVYFAIKNPDALRSEKFTLSKMAIEKNLIGDNTAGLSLINEGSEPNSNIPTPPLVVDAETKK